MAKKNGTAQADTLTGTATADELFGLAGNDVLKGLAGNDYLDGGAGDDDLRGGAGNDIYIVDHAGDINKALADPGVDTVGALISYLLGPQQENITLIGKARLAATGNNFANNLNGNDGNNILIGLGGNDVLDGRKGTDDLRGGAGRDLYLIDQPSEINKALRDDGVDQVHSRFGYTLGIFQEELVLLGSAAVAGVGNDGSNYLQGNDGANSLLGKGGADVLDGGKGADKLFGEAGDDRLFGAAGADVLRGGEGNDQLSGGDEQDTLLGEAGNDVLFGGKGTDTLFGDDGNDTYILDGAVDTAAEIASVADAGTDTVQANFDFTLGAEQENLVFDGTLARHGEGNAKANFMRGTDAGGDELFGMGGDDKLNGGGGNDHLVGGEGNDELNGGAGDDHLVGGDGNDDYFIDHLGDIHEADADPGLDRVNSAITYTLLTHQEELALLSSSSLLNGTGNDGNNLLIGNSGANDLHGQLGADQIIGGGGADRLFGDGGKDLLHYAASAVVIDGGAGDSDTLYLVANDAASVTLDLTGMIARVIIDIETVRFASNLEAVNQSHTLKVNATDVLALSSTTDFLQIFGEADDTVQLSGGGWSKDNGFFLNFQGYSNGNAHVLVDTQILADHVILS